MIKYLKLSSFNSHPKEEPDGQVREGTSDDGSKAGGLQSAPLNVFPVFPAHSLLKTLPYAITFALRNLRSSFW